MLNPAFPLFRYETGDIAELINKDCPYLLWSTIQSIDGRKEDCILLPNGFHISRLDHVFKDSCNVIEAQIVQAKDLSLLFILSDSFCVHPPTKQLFWLSSLSV